MDFAVFRVFWGFRGISRKYLNFAGLRPREISEALVLAFDVLLHSLAALAATFGAVAFYCYL